MTPEQIEAAARLLCEKRGFRPDTLISGVDVDGAYQNTALNEYMEQIRAHHEVLTSIATVLDKDGE